MTDGYTLYALKMVYGGLGAFVMVNFIDMISVLHQGENKKMCTGDVPAGGHADDDAWDPQVQLQPRGLGLRRPLHLLRHVCCTLSSIHFFSNKLAQLIKCQRVTGAYLSIWPY